MRVKITPFEDGYELDDMLHLARLLERHGWHRLLLHFTDGSILMDNEDFSRPQDTPAELPSDERPLEPKP